MGDIARKHHPKSQNPSWKSFSIPACVFHTKPKSRGEKLGIAVNQRGDEGGSWGGTRLVLVPHPKAHPSAAGAVGDAPGAGTDAEQDAQLLRGAAGHHG